MIYFFPSQGHNFRKSRLTFFSRLAWWPSSNVVLLTISWRLCWKRRDYKEGGLDKNPKSKESKIQNTKKVVVIKIRATLSMSFLWHEYQQISGQGHSTSTETIQDVCPRGSWKTWQGDILFLSKINTAKMFGGIVKKQNSSQRSEQNKTSRWIINIFLLQHHFGQVQQDKEKHSKKNVSELRVSTEYHHLNLNSWFYHAAAPDKLRI